MPVTDAASPSLNDRVAGEIRAMLGRKRTSGRELARKLGVSQAWVSYRLSGNQPIDLHDLENIAGALGIPVTQLLPAPEPAGGGSRG